MSMAGKGREPLPRGEAKDKVFQIRLTSETKARWEAEAARKNLTLSDWMRRVLDRNSQPKK